MPIVSASNGIRPEIRALAVFPLGATVTPDVINKHVGTGDYAAKYVSFLNTRFGFKIVANKDGRRVVSYTMIAEPDNVATLRGSTAATKIVIVRKNGKILAEVAGTKTVKTKAPAKVKTAKVAAPTVVKSAVAVDTKRIKTATDKAAIKAKNLETLKAVAAKKKAAPKKKVREFDDVTEQFGTSGEVGTSFSVERDWDSIEGLDLSKLL